MAKMIPKEFEKIVLFLDEIKWKFTSFCFYFSFSVEVLSRASKAKALPNPWQVLHWEESFIRD